MAVRLLATFPLFMLKGEQVLEMNVSLWYPQVGLITWAQGWPYSNQAPGSYIVSLDGICVEPATWFRNPGGFWGPYWSWWPARQRVLSMYNGFEIFYEPKALVAGMTPPEDQLTPANAINTSYVKLKDRRVFFENTANQNRIMAQYNGPTMHPVAESAVFPFQVGLVNPGRGDEDVWVSSPRNSRGCFYDTVKKQIASPLYFFDTRVGEVCQQICYVPEFGVFVSGHTVEAPSTEVPWRRVIRIWALEVNPTVLQPIAPVVGAAKAGQVVTYRSRLLGAHNDPAAGELVNWFVEGVGNLLDIQTKTDVNGYATTRVQYGLTDTGPSTVTARVQC